MSERIGSGPRGVAYSLVRLASSSNCLWSPPQIPGSAGIPAFGLRSVGDWLKPAGRDAWAPRGFSLFQGVAHDMNGSFEEHREWGVGNRESGIGKLFPIPHSLLPTPDSPLP